MAGLHSCMYVQVAEVQEASGAFLVTTSIMTLEIRAVIRAFLWLESHDYTQSCMLSDSVSVI